MKFRATIARVAILHTLEVLTRTHFSLQELVELVKAKKAAQMAK